MDMPETPAADGLAVTDERPPTRSYSIERRVEFQNAPSTSSSLSSVVQFIPARGSIYVSVADNGRGRYSVYLWPARHEDDSKSAHYAGEVVDGRTRPAMNPIYTRPLWLAPFLDALADEAHAGARSLADRAVQAGAKEPLEG